MKTKIRHPEKVNKPVNPIKKKPDWIRSKLSNSKEFFLTKTIVNQNKESKKMILIKNNFFLLTSTLVDFIHSHFFSKFFFNTN